MKLIGGSVMKTNILLDIIYIVFLKTLTDELNWWLAVTIVENKYCTGKKYLCVKKMAVNDVATHQKSRFVIASKVVGLYLNICHSRKALKRLLQNECIMCTSIFCWGRGGWTSYQIFKKGEGGAWQNLSF